MNYKNWRVDGNPESELMLHNKGPSRLLVKADISTCFPSIYTHSIEGLEQNQDFFTLLLSNDEIKRQVLGVFTEEIYRSLREKLLISEGNCDYLTTTDLLFL